MMLQTPLRSKPLDSVAGAIVAGTGEPVVLLHGVGMQAAAWGPQSASLSATHRVIALNMPGHGGRAILPGKPLLPDYVAWLAKVLRPIGPVNLVGHSMGALIAAGLAIEHPDLVLRLAVLNGVHLRSATAKAAVLTRADEIAQDMGDINVPLSRWFGDTAHDQAIRAQVADWLHAVDPAGYAAAYRAFAMGDAVYADRWASIACPALVLTGDGDANSTAEMAQKMAALAQQGRAVVIKGHRHMVNLTAPQTVTAALRDWLATPLDGMKGTGK